MDFSGKVVVVTGAGQGIGACIAVAFAKARAIVVLAEIDEEAALEVKEKIELQNQHCLYIHTDVAEEGSVQQMVNEVVERYGKIDILINNAGINEEGSLFTTTVASFEHIMRVNVTGSYLCAKYCATYMKGDGCSIINIASTKALMSEPHTEAYATSKGALLALTHALANTLANKVRVNCISPGKIDVSKWKKKKERKFTAFSEKAYKQHLIERMGEPEDVANMALFLASNQTEFITGQNFIVDGGQRIKLYREE